MRSAAASAVSLAIAATAVACGVAADRLGRRRVLMWSYILGTVACLAVCLIPSGIVYLAGNVFAGIAYGMMLTATYAFIKAVTPADSLGKAIGLYGMYSIVLGTVMSLAGGVLAEIDWRYLYLIVPAMCVPSFVLTPRLLPTMPRVGSGPVDVPGLILLGAGILLAITGFLEVGTNPSSVAGWLFVAGGAALLAAWVVLELRRHAPSYPVRIVRHPAFVGALIAGIFLNGVYAALVITLSDYLQYAKQGSVFAATFGLQPFYLIGAAAWAIAGRQLGAGRSPRFVAAVSALIAAVGFVALIPLDHSSAYWLILPGSLLVGYGTNAALTAQAKIFVDMAPPDAYGAVTSSRFTVGELGYTIGMIITTLFLSRFTAQGIIEGLEARGYSPADAYAMLATLNTWLLSGQQPDIDNLKGVMSVVAGAFDAALRLRMIVGAAVMAVTAAAVWLLMKERRDR